ncbi:hypothetical protein [Lapidilactobacillus wuchangensis]|uniref:hypothetical protein n=1 Tax=Lapidilactobacillus wuchangensis TaxID=2486001 RepID=UPI0013DE2C73|nr:hypothetical protein [Lapidilactobacillus wuchangensis]
MEGVVVSRQILLSNLLLRRRLVFETIAVFNWFKSMPAAFHNQKARNGVRFSSAPCFHRVFEHQYNDKLTTKIRLIFF